MSTNDEKNQQYCDKLEEYLKKVLKDNNENILDDIENLRAILIASNFEQIRTVAKRVDLEYVFRRLIHLPEMSESLESTITMFIGALNPQEILLQYEKLIINEALNQRLCSQESIQIWLNKIVTPSVVPVEALENISSKLSLSSLIERCLELLLSPTTKIATQASRILLTFAQKHEEQLFSGNLLQEMTNVQNFTESQVEKYSFSKADSDTVKIRFFQLFADIASISEKHLKILSKTNGTAFIENFNMKFMDDPLIGMNLLRILTGIVHCEHTRKDIQSSGIVQTFVDKILLMNQDDPLDMLLLPSLFQFVIRFGAYDSNFLAKNSKILLQLFQFLEQSNPTTIELALESIGYLAQYPSGKVLLNNYDVHFLAPISMLMDDTRESIQISSLTTINQLFYVDTKWSDDPLTLAALAVPSQWFEQLNTDNYLVQKLTKYVHEPFQHVRLAAMKCIQTLVSVDYGQKFMCDYKKFKEWLLNRKTESNPDGREAKWKIVNVIASSKFVRQNFEGKDYLALREYMKSGPVEPQVEMTNSSS